MRSSRSPVVRQMLHVVSVAGLSMLAPEAAFASTIAQNVAWTIDRPETDVKVRIVSYGDSIFAGYKGEIDEVAIWAAPTVDGDYAAAEWKVDVETIRRSKSGAVAKEVYEDKIVGDSRFMETASTRVVAFEMCGNDALQARNDFREENGECDHEPLEDALADCTQYLEKAMQYINEHAGPNTKLKLVVNLYYPGFDADDREADCTDTGQNPNLQDVFLPYLLRMNWRACDFARQHGFRCVDAFAQYMGADYDSNGDGKRDSRALRGTLRDPNAHFVTAKRSFDYIQSDDTHPTFHGGDIDLGLLGGSARGESGQRYVDAQYADGKVPIWRRFGHERMGTGMSVYNPDTP
jgi:hypothetical protein